MLNLNHKVKSIKCNLPVTSYLLTSAWECFPVQIYHKCSGLIILHTHVKYMLDEEQYEL